MNAPTEVRLAEQLKTVPADDPKSARIGIFRRITVERYMRPLEADEPALLALWRGGLLPVGLLLLAAAVALLWLC